MFKKIVLGALALGLIAILTIGAVNRTNSKASEQSSTRHGQTTAVAAGQGAQVEQRGGGGGQGRGRQETSPQALPSQPQGRQGGGSQGGRGQLDSGIQGKEGLGQGRGYGQLPEGTTQSWQIIPGVIVSVADDLLTVKTNSGQMIGVEGQPLKYLVSQGCVPQVGSQVTLAGFDEAGEFKVGEFTDHTGNLKVKLRDQSGRPMWSRRGQRG
jgi:hypothetical protein